MSESNLSDVSDDNEPIIPILPTWNEFQEGAREAKFMLVM